MKRKPIKRLLVVASPGGHWQQLLSLSESWSGYEVSYAGACGEIDLPGGHEVEPLPDASRGSLSKLLGLFRSAAWLVIRVRPQAVVTTGAAPGLVVLVLAKLVGAKTVWIDSLANVERLSLAGRLARPFTDLWLTQWPHLAKSSGPEYAGAIL